MIAPVFESVEQELTGTATDTRRDLGHTAHLRRLRQGALVGQALLNRRGATDAAAVEHAIAGNLCRCGTYPNVVAAVLSVAKGGA